jgi:hypothetical protein
MKIAKGGDDCARLWIPVPSFRKREKRLPPKPNPAKWQSRTAAIDSWPSAQGADLKKLP